MVGWKRPFVFSRRRGIFQLPSLTAYQTDHMLHESKCPCSLCFPISFVGGKEILLHCRSAPQSWYSAYSDSLLISCRWVFIHIRAQRERERGYIASLTGRWRARHPCMIHRPINSLPRTRWVASHILNGQDEGGGVGFWCK